MEGSGEGKGADAIGHTNMLWKLPKLNILATSTHTIFICREFVLGCREQPSTLITAVGVENVNFSDPVFPPDVQVQQRDNKPSGNAVEETEVQWIDDNDDGGVGG